ncbi:hypothetical protein HMPREF3185_00269 [Porphyromonas somerae]|uniref:Uncharacterized protein n=1 Tax=Porphyromonas somerae TaxID=322095 RepID=A0A134BE07_9PORP|nr:hypothetical protein HMPREF3184_00269 [Porphyromonadaceae bacterium KA00676]KXB78182.1 hypothetical protein HMPREF3185_00269 [Porphyromonas somerae]
MTYIGQLADQYRFTHRLHSACCFPLRRWRIHRDLCWRDDGVVRRGE